MCLASCSSVSRTQREQQYRLQREPKFKVWWSDNYSSLFQKSTFTWLLVELMTLFCYLIVHYLEQQHISLNRAWAGEWVQKKKQNSKQQKTKEKQQKNISLFHSYPFYALHYVQLTTSVLLVKQKCYTEIKYWRYYIYPLIY